MVCSSKVSAHAPVIACGNDATAASFLFLVCTVLDAETDLFDSIVENGSVLVVTDTTKVDDWVRWENVLGATGCILSSTASDKLCIVIV
jgi:hypothetical protein